MVELCDPSRAQGVALESCCRLCGRLENLGSLVVAGRSLQDPAAARAALQVWAVAEGEPDLDAFCRANLGGEGATEVVGRLQRGEPVSTSFDVVAFLFPGMAGSFGMGAEEAPPEPGALVGGSPVVEPAPAPGVAVPRRAPTPATPEPEDPRIAVRALVAVMLADGVIRVGERRFLDRFTANAGLPPLGDADLRPWRPADVGWPSAPAPILEAMAELALIDRERDGTEWRVVREFARHWGQPLGPLEERGRRLEEATAPAMTRLWRALRRLVITERA